MLGWMQWYYSAITRTSFDSSAPDSYCAAMVARFDTTPGFVPKGSAAMPCQLLSHPIAMRGAAIIVLFALFAGRLLTLVALRGHSGHSLAGRWSIAN